MQRTEYIETLKTTAIKSISSSTVRFLFSKFSFLSWGPFGPLVNFLVKELVTVMANETEMRLFFAYTDFRVSQQGKDFIEKANQYEEMKKTTSKEELLRYEKELIDSFRAFARLR